MKGILGDSSRYNVALVCIYSVPALTNSKLNNSTPNSVKCVH